MKIGLIAIATGKYTHFIPELYEGFKNNFFVNDERTLFCITDNITDSAIPKEVVTLQTTHEPWPGPTLKRYHKILEHEDAFKGYDYIFMIDADMLIVNKVDSEILPKDYEKVTGTLHPGFLHKPGTYETNPISTACIDPLKGQFYYAGAFNGGFTRAFLNMCRVIANNIDQDLVKNYIAIWNDESHLNKYYSEHPPKRLTPEYCYPQHVNFDLLPFEKRIIAITKQLSEYQQ